MHIRPFEIALIGIFAILGLAGLFYLSAYKSPASDEQKLYGESISIWGTLDERIMNNFLLELTKVNQALAVVKYRRIDARAFDGELVNAIAEGRSPDIVLLPHTLLVSYRSKIQAISLETIDTRTFRDTYIDGAEIFMRSDGTYGLPFAVDPLVMYWNRDIFSSSGLAQPPKTWETIVSQTTNAIVRMDDERNITQSAIAFGEYANIARAKEILSMLFFQSGSTIVDEGEDGYFVSLGRGADDSGLTPGDAVLTFYTQFATPNKNLYSWNRSKSLDRTEFLGGTLGLYFGLGSEKSSLERENANLNFDIAPVPQGSGSTVERNYGTFYAFAIPRASHNIQGAYAVASLLASPANAKMITDAYGLAPVHRALFTGAIADPYKSVIYQSALLARGWLDPSPQESSDIFRNMIEAMTAGRTRTKGVIIDAVYQLESLFN